MTKKARFTQAEIARVLRAVKQEDVAVEVELSQDGNILLRPVSGTQPARRVDPMVDFKL
jgi:hypothetical protein